VLRKEGVLRKEALVVVVIVTAVLMAGCTIGAEQPAEVGSGVEATTQQKIPVGKLPVPRGLEVTPNTPRFFKEALEKKKPIILLFYAEGDVVSSQLITEIQKAVSDPDYKGRFTLILLDTEDAEKSSRLAEEFGVNHVPQLALIDGQGTVQKEYRGYVDSTTIKQAMYSIINQ
jgi:hypothetical protein